MAESLHTSQTPSTTDASDGTPGIITAVTLMFALDGQITHVRFYATATVSGTYTAKVYQVTGADTGGAGTGTELASKAVSSGITGGTWNNIALDTPVSVDTTHAYRCGVHSSAGRYVATNNVFTSGGGGITNGNLIAPANLSVAPGFEINQGTFGINASPAYPTLVGSAADYFADVVFVVSGDEVDPSGIAVAATPGTPALSQALSVAPSGATAAATAGSPTLTWSASIAPSGATAAATAGSPAVGQALSVAPSGIAVSATAGTPALSQTIEPGFSVAPDGIAVTAVAGSPTLVQTVARTGGWGTLSAIVREARQDHAREQERLSNPIDCPEHGWPLELTPRGRHCKFGGHVVR